MIRRAAWLGLAGGALLSGSAAADWTATTLATPQPVTAITQIGPDVYLDAGSIYRLSSCRTAIVCLDGARLPASQTPADGIPGGTIAVAAGAGVAAAYYGAPTRRYDHGILGDAVEGGALIVTDRSGQRFELTLDQAHVFEDIAPRIVDMDGDGLNDVVTIRSGLTTGAGVAVYSVAGGSLHEIGAIPEIGLSHRWLNIAGIADFNGDGAIDIALVRTPHIGGRLELWTLSGGGFVRLAAAEGFSNHAIGSTMLGMSAVADIDGDRVVDLAVPSADRTVLRFMSARSGSWHEVASVAAGSPIVTGVGVLVQRDGPAFVAATAAGTTILVTP